MSNYGSDPYNPPVGQPGAQGSADPFAPGSAPAGYSGAPGAPPQYPGGAYGSSAGQVEPPVRPPTVAYAFYAWLAITVLALISVILVLTSPIWEIAVRAGLQDAGSAAAGIDPSGIVAAAKITVVIVFVVSAGLYLFFAFKMFAGRNWARIVLTVLGAFTALSAVTPTYGTVNLGNQSFTANNYGINWINGILAVAAIVLMFLPQSSAYFTASKAYRSRLR